MPHKSRRTLALVAVLAVVVIGIAAQEIRYELRSYSVLAHFADPESSGSLLRWESNPVVVDDVSVPSAGSAAAARLYLPIGVSRPPGIVLIHGIHHLGIADPRFVNFARALAGDGFAVLTPLLTALADYRVDAASISLIGESSQWLENRLGTGPPVVIALSFGGGLALLAAADARFAPHIRAVVSFGGYHSLARVSRFLATDEAQLPDGRFVPFKAHDYGAAVFVYAHLGRFFDPSDLPAAHEAIRLWLWEQPEEARARLAKLTPGGRAIVEALLARRIDVLRKQLLDAIHADAAQLDAFSPEGKISKLAVPVFIVHGSADNVIPYTESLWLEREVPKEMLRGMLITSVFSHVDPQGSSLYQRLRLVHFMAKVLRSAS